MALVTTAQPGPVRFASTFPEERLRVLAEVENSHFWFLGRRRLALEALTRHVRPGATVLDVGCGTGNWLGQLVNCGYRALGLDLFEEATRKARAGTAAPVVRACAEELPIRSGCLDAVTLLDVMEHVDDRSLTRQVADALAPGGVALATVPAGPWLRSFRDEAAGHRRRYDRALLIEALEAGGLEIVEMRYYQCLLFPLVVASRLLGRSGATRELEDRPGRLVNRLLHFVTTLELAAGRWLSWPWGSTLLVIARRPQP